jgi:oxaloacetate decarboxylase gamma subunit
MQESIIQQGIDLMLFGMTTVFIFLSLLVIATTAMSSLVQRFAPAPELPEASKPTNSANPAPFNNPKLVRIIEAAIKQHRSKP